MVIVFFIYTAACICGVVGSIYSFINKNKAMHLFSLAAFIFGLLVVNIINVFILHGDTKGSSVIDGIIIGVQVCFIIYLIYKGRKLWYQQKEELLKKIQE